MLSPRDAADSVASFTCIGDSAGLTIPGFTVLAFIKKALLIMISLRLLINSMLGYAYMVVDIHDEHESAHVHAGGYLPSDTQLMDEGKDYEPLNSLMAHCRILLDQSPRQRNSGIQSAFTLARIFPQVN